MIRFRDETAIGWRSICSSMSIARGCTAVSTRSNHGSSVYTNVMKTDALKQALDHHGFDAAFGGARRDEESSRAKERVFSVRAPGHVWDPRRQRAEPWRIYNFPARRGRDHAGVSTLQLDGIECLAHLQQLERAHIG